MEKKALGRFLIVVNPISGGGRGEQLLNKIVRGTKAMQILADQARIEHPDSWQVLHTTKDGSWKKELESRLKGHLADVVIAIGGDGTLMETASVLKNFREVAMLPVPGGRGNDCIRALCGYTLKHGDFFEWALTQKTWAKKPLDLGDANGNLFINMASIGYGGDVVQKAHERSAPWSKTSLVYQIEGALGLFETKERQCEVKVDDRVVYQGPFFGAFVGNGQCNGAGLYWTRNASFHDGKLDVIAFRRPKIFQMLGALSAVKKKEAPGFEHSEAQGSEIVFHFDQPTALELDGDYRGNALRHGFKCLPHSLNVWVLTH